MAVKLEKKDQAFRNTLIFYGDAKTISLDRVLLNLFMLIKYNGRGIRTKPGTKKDADMIDTIVKRIVKLEEEDKAEGALEFSEQVRWWVISNLSDLVNRGVPGKEQFASLKAIHLNSYKFRNARHVRDYNMSEQVFAMLRESHPEVINKLKEFLEFGWNESIYGIASHNDLDLDTLGILRIVDDVRLKDSPSSDKELVPNSCICPGQARMFGEDIRRILIYRDFVPRHVLLDYIKNMMGLHLALYVFKILYLLPDWVQRGERHPACRSCPVKPDLKNPFEHCPYHEHTQFVVDCGDDPESNIASLAEQDNARIYQQIHDYVRSVFKINMAIQYLQTYNRPHAENIDLALETIKTGGIDWDSQFRNRFQNISTKANKKEDEIEQLEAMIEPIRQLGLPPFEQFIETVTLIRGGFHFRYYREMLDSLLQRGKESGLIWSGRSRKHERRFWFSGRMLETMVQLLVLKDDDHSGFSAEPIMIEALLEELNNRYGFIINGIGHDKYSQADIVTHQAFRDNVVRLKERLREIGFFNVLSDAYIMQRIRPRYTM